MPANPFGTDDPLGPSGGAWGGAGQGQGGFGANGGRAAAYADDEYDEVDIESGPADASATVGKKSKNKTPARSAAPARPQDMASREAELARREQEVARREAHLNRLQSGFNPLNVKNWPPCCPVVHHDIPNDIPDGKKGITRAGFFIFLLTITFLAFNAVAVLIGLIDGPDDGGPGVAALLMAIIYMIVGIPGAWILWYNRLYRAMMSDGALSFGVFFLIFLIHIAFCIWSAVAPNVIGTDWAHAGFMSAIQLLKDDATLASIFYFASGGAWAFLAFLSVTYLARVYSFFRRSGGEQRMQQEAMTAGVQMAGNQGAR